MFEKIIGHKKEIELLKKMISENKLAHAYLFSGKEGIGKLQVAKEFAKSILDVEVLESSPDYKYIEKNADKKDILIEQIRTEIIDDVYISPAASKYKVYVINDADYLNIASQNALLKTLEEPPRYVVIILIASNTSAFLSTILSRVNNIVFSNIETNLIKEYVKNNYNLELTENLLNYIDGSIGKAKNIIENNKLEQLEKIDNLYTILLKKDVITSMQISADIDFNENINLEYLEYILYSNLKYSCVKFIEKARNRLKFNGNYDIVIDSMILKIIDNI